MEEHKRKDLTPLSCGTPQAGNKTGEYERSARTRIFMRTRVATLAAASVFTLPARWLSIPRLVNS